MMVVDLSLVVFYENVKQRVVRLSWAREVDLQAIDVHLGLGLVLFYSNLNS